jgi:hypothetical protein
MDKQIVDRLDKACPALKTAALGTYVDTLDTRLTKTPYVQKVSVTADATGGQSFVAEVSGEIIDVWAVSTASNASATLTVRRSTTAITSAISVATANALTRTTQLVQAQKIVTKGETLNIIANDANDRGIVYIAILPS